MKFTHREGPFVATITGDLLSVHRCQAEEKWGIESGALTGNGVSMLFLCSLHQMPWFVVHSDGLYAQNAHDALTPLYRDEDAAQLLRCINELLTTTESKRSRRKGLIKYGCAVVIAYLTGMLIGLGAYVFSFITAPDPHILTTVDTRSAYHPDAGLSRLIPDEPGVPAAKPALDSNAGTYSSQPTQQPQHQRPPAATPDDGWNLPLSVRTELPARLSKAASRGLFTVPLSSGHKRTVYVFSDPNCPECQRMERHIETAAGTVNVVIFPVTIRGGVLSLQKLTPVMSLPESARAEAWKRLFSADTGVSVPGTMLATPAPDENTAELARGAIGVNEVAYHAYRLPGTPWTISDDGRYVPQSVLSSPAALTDFLNGGGHDGQ